MISIGRIPGLGHHVAFLDSANAIYQAPRSQRSEGINAVKKL